MGDYGYARSGYNYKPQEKSMASWDNANNGYEKNSYGWGQTGFANSEPPRDHVCKPVIIDAQGRKRPLVAYGPNSQNDGFVTKTETVVEQVCVPQTTKHGHSSPPEDYGVVNDRWSRPVSPTYNRPIRTNVVSSLNWRQTPHSNGYTPNSNGYGGMNAYGGNYENGYNTSNRPNHTAPDPYYQGNNHTAPGPYYQGNNHTITDRQEPTMITSGGWARPNRLAWASPPNKEGALTHATNDIGTALEYMQEATKPTSGNMASTPRFTIPTPRVPTIDSREARRKYGRSLSASPQMAATPTDSYSSAIDSREAVRRYGGQLM